MFALAIGADGFRELAPRSAFFYGQTTEGPRTRATLLAQIKFWKDAEHRRRNYLNIYDKSILCASA